jgi:hypothetical protein
VPDSDLELAHLLATESVLSLVYLYIHSVTYVTSNTSSTEYNYNRFIYYNTTYYIPYFLAYKTHRPIRHTGP